MNMAASASASTSSISDSATQFSEAIPGYPKFHMTHGGGLATVELYLNGATVVSWKVAQQELLFVSPKSVYTAGKAIRGGIPIVFPQFGPGKLPQHGFARNKMWRHGVTTLNKATGDVTSTFHLSQDDETLAVWPHKFELTLTLVLKSSSLSQQLTVVNTDSHPFEFTTLLHTYFSVQHINQTHVTGLKDLSYLDKPNGGELVLERDSSITFTGEVDRVYLDGGSRDIVISDGGNADILVKSRGFADIVVWNPAAEKAKGMNDLGQENYQHFVCVETGTVNRAITLQQGQKWDGSQGLSLRLNTTGIYDAASNNTSS